MIFIGLLQACSGDPDTDSSVSASAPAPLATAPVVVGPAATGLKQALFTAMGGWEALQATRILVQQGRGIRQHLGQIPVTGGVDPQATLDPLTETIDLVNGRAAFTYTVTVEGGVAQQRTEAYTSYHDQRLGWGTTAGRPNSVTSVNGLFSWATHNTPEFLTRRNPITLALSAVNIADTAVSLERKLDGVPHWYLETTLNGETIGLYLDQQTSLLHAFTAMDTESLRGDQNATYIYDDYRPVGALQLPHQVEIRHGNDVFASLTYDRITLDDASALAILEIPTDVIAQADQVVAQQLGGRNNQSWVPLEWVEVAPGVSQSVAFSHHSMVVEFASFVVVIEGPYTEAQSLTLARMVTEKFGKPIRYVVPSHPHHDHAGGLRALAAIGASVLSAAGHEAEIRAIVEAPHTNPPDALAQNIANGMEVGHVEVFTGMTDISEEDQQVLLFELATMPHVNPNVLAYVPSSKVLFQSDLFFGTPGPDAVALYQAILELGLEVEQIVGGHGGVLPFATLETAVTASD